MFITREDLDNSLYEETINAIVRFYDGNEPKAQARIDYGIRTAISTVEAHICSLWDASQIFSKTGVERNPMLVDICCNIALYIIADVLEVIPVTIAGPYKDAMKLLKKIVKSEISIPGATRPVDPETGAPDNYIKHGGIARIY